MEKIRLEDEAKLDKQREIQRIKDMREFYNQKLLRKYILGTFQKLIDIKNKKIFEADTFREYQIKKFGLQKLRTAAGILAYSR